MGVDFEYKTFPVKFDDLKPAKSKIADPNFLQLLQSNGISFTTSLKCRWHRSHGQRFASLCCSLWWKNVRAYISLHDIYDIWTGQLKRIPDIVFLCILKSNLSLYSVRLFGPNQNPMLKRSEFFPRLKSLMQVMFYQDSWWRSGVWCCTNSHWCVLIPTLIFSDLILLHIPLHTLLLPSIFTFTSIAPYLLRSDPIRSSSTPMVSKNQKSGIKKSGWGCVIISRYIKFIVNYSFIFYCEQVEGLLCQTHLIAQQMKIDAFVQ